MRKDYNIYTSIESKYGFSIPNDYRELEKRGYMNLETPSICTEFTVPGKGYLWLNDMEWYTPEKIAKFEFEDYHLPGFVPFAFTGGGDYWCWHPEYSDTSGTRVVLCPHDYELGTIYAPNFHTALYRQILEYACYGIDSTQSLDEAKAFLDRWSKDLVCIFPQKWCNRISDLRKNRLVSWFEYKIECIGLLLPEQVKEIEASDIQFPLLDEKFQWMVP